MEVLQVGQSSIDKTNSSSKKSPLKDEFLKLLTTQLRYQNPLNPMDNTEFTAQLAQLSSLEALNNLVLQMSDMLLYQNSIQNTLTLNLIGKQVKFAGNKINLKEKAEISYNLSTDATKVNISIYDSSGKLVKTIDVGSQKAGSHTFIWDGKDANGNKLPEGEYTFKITASDKDNKPVEVSSLTKGIVTGVTFENNVTYIIVNGNIKIKLNEILEISGGGTT
ncbi:MAG: hypothetical protein N3A59_08950 [Thermodesulfovibrionales bacterium]|nr:hypothetical protein [Thermodesulfovibrionales bacterium]